MKWDELRRGQFEYSSEALRLPIGIASALSLLWPAAGALVDHFFPASGISRFFLIAFFLHLGLGIIANGLVLVYENHCRTRDGKPILLLRIQGRNGTYYESDRVWRARIRSFFFLLLGAGIFGLGVLILVSTLTRKS